MKVVIQRVSAASVTIDDHVNAEIGRGLLILLGIENADTEDDIHWLVNKILNLRIFGDTCGVMNLSVTDIVGELLVISQFTLHAMTKKGNRPSYIRAAGPEVARPLYHKFIASLEIQSGRAISTGKFGADMRVSLVNDGPVTIIIDSKSRE